MSELIEIGDPQIICPTCKGNNIMMQKEGDGFVHVCKCGEVWE